MIANLPLTMSNVLDVLRANGIQVGDDGVKTEYMRVIFSRSLMSHKVTIYFHYVSSHVDRIRLMEDKATCVILMSFNMQDASNQYTRAVTQEMSF